MRAIGDFSGSRKGPRFAIYVATGFDQPTEVAIDMMSIRYTEQLEVDDALPYYKTIHETISLVYRLRNGDMRTISRNRCGRQPESLLSSNEVIIGRRLASQLEAQICARPLFTEL